MAIVYFFLVDLNFGYRLVTYFDLLRLYPGTNRIYKKFQGFRSEVGILRIQFTFYFEVIGCKAGSLQIPAERNVFTGSNVDIRDQHARLPISRGV